MRHTDIEQALLDGTRADVQGVDVFDVCDGCGCYMEDDGTHLCPECR